jgi:hypothetical protein
MAGADLPDELPEAWVERAREEAEEDVPRTLSEPASGGGGDDDAVEQTIDEVKRRIFPYHGLG